jgi:hypothetical protein
MPARPRKRWTFGAVALVALGLLILVPSGLCTGIGGLVAFGEGGEGLRVILPMVLMFGVPAILLGWLFVWLGLRQRRQD